MRCHESNPFDGGPDGDADGNRLWVAGLGIELHVENGEAGVDVVELSEGAGHENLLLGSSGDEVVEEGLEVLDGLDRGILEIEALGLVVGD